MFETINEYVEYYESMTAPEYVRLQEKLADDLFEGGSYEDYEKAMRLTIGQTLSRLYKGITDVETLKEALEHLKHGEDIDIIKFTVDAIERALWLLENETI